MNDLSDYWMEKSFFNAKFMLKYHSNLIMNVYLLLLSLSFGTKFLVIPFFSRKYKNNRENKIKPIIYSEVVISR